MRTLVVGAGAIGGVLAARLLAAGASVSIATRSAETADLLRASGLHVTGVGGSASLEAPDVGPVEAHAGREPFDLIVLATKAQDAIDVAPRLTMLLARGGALLPIQNGGVSLTLGRALGEPVL